MGIEVRIEGLSGSLITSVRCQRLEAEGADEESRIRSVLLEGIVVEYNPIELMGGDYSRVKIRADKNDALVDLDRAGSSQDMQDDPFSLPSRLPAIHLASLNLTVNKGGRLWQIDDGALTLGPPDQNGTQEGLVKAQRTVLDAEDLRDEWSRIHCPFSYSERRISIGPLRAGDEENLLEAEAILAEGDRLGADISMIARLFDGHFRVHGCYEEEKNRSLEARIEVDGVDLGAASRWWRKRLGKDYSLGGGLQAEMEVQVELDDLSTLQAGGTLALMEGRFQGVSPIELDLEARFDQNMLEIEKSHAEIGESSLDLSESSIPFRNGLPILEEAQGDLAFLLEDIGEELEEAGLETKHLDLLADADGQGQGEIRNGRLELESLRFYSEKGEISIQDLSLSYTEGEVRAEISRLEGRYARKDFLLLEPATFVFTPDGMETASLMMRSGNGLVHLDAHVSPDMIGKIHADIRDVDLDLLADLLPHGLHERVGWKGFNLALDAEGTLSEITGNLSLTLNEFHYDTLFLRDLHLQARARPDRIDVETIDCMVREGGFCKASGGWNLTPGDPWTLPERFEALLEIDDLNLGCLEGLNESLKDLSGSADLSLRMEGDPSNPTAKLALQGSMPALPPVLTSMVGNKIDLEGSWRFNLEMSQHGEGIAVDRLDLMGKAGSIIATASFPARLTPLGNDALYSLDSHGPFEAVATLDQLGLILHEDFDMILSADVSLTGPFRFPEGDFRVHAAGLAYGNIDSHDLLLDGALDEGVLRIEDLALQRSGKKVLDGSLSIDLKDEESETLTLPGPETAIELNLAMNEEDVVPYASVFDLPIKGKASLAIEGRGPMADPRLFMNLTLKEGEVVFATRETNGIVEANGLDGDLAYPLDLHLTMESRPEGIEIQEISIQSQNSSFAGSGRLPLHLGLRPILEGRLLDSRGAMDGTLDFSGFNLSEFGKLVPESRRLTGFVSGNITVFGTPERPELKSRLELSRGTLRFRGQLPSLEEVAALIEVDEESYRISRFDGMMGAGSVSLTGSVAHSRLIPTDFDLVITGHNALLYRSSGIRVRGDLDVAIQGPMKEPRVTGEIAIRDSRYVRRISLIPERGPPPVESEIHPFSLTGPVFRDMAFDLRIITKEPGALLLENNLVSGEVKLDLSIEGTGLKPYYVGSFSFNDMLLRLPSFRFRVDSGYILYSRQNPFQPVINFVARGRRQSYDVDLVVEGPLSNPDFFLTSNPPLDHDELVVLVASGAIPKGSHAATQVGAYLAEEIYYEFFSTESTEAGEDLFDRLELNIGTEVGPDGAQNFVLEYRLNGPWYAHVEEDIYKDWNTGIVYRIRFR
ncbi:MAG: translocation/assembly module TamB domain-containing protein [Planctomycetota bacterium]